MPTCCVSLTQPWYSGMPHGKRHDVPSFEPKRQTITFPGGSVQVSITEIRTAAHVGTHIDAARHFFPDGPSIDAYPTGRFVGPGVVLDAAREGPVPLTALELQKMRPEIRRGDIVFIYFGYAERFGRDDYRTHPYLAVDAAEFLIERGANIMGTDTITPDVPVVTRQPGVEDLDGDRSVEDLVLPLPHLRHPAAIDQSYKPVAAGQDGLRDDPGVGHGIHGTDRRRRRAGQAGLGPSTPRPGRRRRSRGGRRASR